MAEDGRGGGASLDLKTIDDEVRAFIEDSGLDFPSDAQTRSAAEQRGFYDAMCRRFAGPRPAGLTVEDAAALGPAGAIPIRRYAPAAAGVLSASAPQILYLHGGGWYLGGLDSHDDVCAEIAASLALPVTGVDYRLAPEHPHPAAFEDAFAVAEMLRAEGRPLIVVGDSVGGCLAAALLLAYRDGAREDGGRGDGPPLRGAALIYPSLSGGAQSLPAYAENADAPLFTAAENARASRRYAGAADPAALAANDPRFAPLFAPDLSGAAPCHALAVDLDPLRDDAAAFAARLSAAGGTASAVTFAGLPHGCLRARRRSVKAALFFAAILAAIAQLRDI